MAVTDTIIRRGGTGKQVLEGPKYLHGPTSDRRRKVGAAVDRITGDVDFYEVGDCICDVDVATPPGAYAFTIEPFLERGFRRPIKAIKWVAVVQMEEGKAPELLFRKLVGASDRKFFTPQFTVKPNTRLFLSIQRMGGISSIQYKLSLDSEVAPVRSKTSSEKAVKSAEPKPMVQKTEADKAWDLVKILGDKD